MSAAVCGKRSFLEDIDLSPSSPTSSPPSALSQAYKKFRCSSPGRFAYTPPLHSDRIDRLKDLFPGMEVQLLEKALDESSNDLESAIKRLHELCLSNFNWSTGSTAEEFVKMEKVSVLLEDPEFQNNIPLDGAQWVDLFVSEMMSAATIDDARCRAANLLERLEKSISSRANAEAVQNLTRENLLLNAQIDAISLDNVILKRAVSIQHERLKEHDERNQELLHLKQMLAQYQEQLRNLEVNNYALKLQLRQAHQSNSIPGRFHPDVF